MSYIGNVHDYIRYWNGLTLEINGPDMIYVLENDTIINAKYMRDFEIISKSAHDDWVKSMKIPYTKYLK